MVFSYLGNDEAAEATVAAVEAAGGKALAVKGSVTDEADVIALFDRAMDAFGPIDGVVNNAGILSTGDAVRRHVGRADASGRRHQCASVPISSAREGVRRMAKSRGGRGGSIVNLSSAAAKLGAPNEYVDYAGSKGGDGVR